MMNTALPQPLIPSADDFAAASRRTRRKMFLWTVFLAALAGSSFIAFGIDNLDIPLSLLICLITPVLLWRYPRLALTMTFACVCLFEMFPRDFADSTTDRVPFFWNVNTIFQRYAHLDFKAVPLNLFELFVITAALCSTFRSVFSGHTKLRGGPFLLPIAGYVGFVAFGWVNGLVSGGDFTISLQEVRSQFYLLMAYLMAVNLVQEKKHVNQLLWIFVVCVGLKGILYTFRQYVTLAGVPISDQGVGSHEEAFFFDMFLMLLAICTLCNVHQKLRWLMWSLVPFVALGNLACNRRAGTAAVAIAVPILILAAYRALPERRKLIAIVSLSFLTLFSLYYSAFKNNSSAFAQPARAIRSQFTPDDRDAESNNYRDAEDADLIATIKISPVIGYGYGKRMLHVAPIADISAIYEYWDIMTHNQILWVWMRVGSIGFVMFWLMVSAILIYACQTIRIEGADSEVKAIGLFLLTTLIMLIMFGLLDLQLSNYRNMLMTGVWIGVLAAARNFVKPKFAKASP